MINSLISSSYYIFVEKFHAFLVHDIYFIQIEWHDCLNSMDWELSDFFSLSSSISNSFELYCFKTNLFVTPFTVVSGYYFSRKANCLSSSELLELIPKNFLTLLVKGTSSSFFGASEPAWCELLSNRLDPLSECCGESCLNKSVESEFFSYEVLNSGLKLSSFDNPRFRWCETLSAREFFKKLDIDPDNL